ncbi:MAG: sensor domain-containing phosphodiesterase [Zymomonas sp.]|nr:MAG: sensor domain-containing phosphodiesterase [Zymomonas sp.]
MPELDEDARLDALRKLNLLDTAPSESFDRITRMASQIFNLPIAAVSLTDHDRQWFKSRVGVPHDSIPRKNAPCAEVAETRELLVIPDLAANPCYADSHLAQNGVAFYAGAPLVTRDGLGLGALCVLGTEPRTVSAAEAAALTDLAAMVMSQIELQHAFGRVDPVSGLPNRNQFMDDLEDMGRDHGGQRRLAVLVDLAENTQLSNYARVLGPSSVDKMVREASLRLTRTLGPGRTGYHVSATQFAYLAPVGAVESEYVPLLRSTMAKVGLESTTQFLMTVVAGVAPMVFGDIAQTDLLRALQSAVEEARSTSLTVGLYNPQADAAHTRRFTLLQDFEAALGADDQLRLVFQPRIDLATRQCVGSEALLRWRHPTLGAISPGEFVPVIEPSSHTHAMTDWVIRKAVRQIQDWQAVGIDLQLSVNVSASNLEDPGFVQRVLAVVAEHGLEPDRLELEVTESAVMKDAENALDRLSMLAAAGIKLSIDDFGTGYSSLAYLQKLPVHVVKIDQSFVKDIEEGEREQSLVRSMITLSHELGYRVVGEGVETAAAADLLAEMGCEEAQGYFFARPMEASDFAAWTASFRRGALAA